ncbi:hypothetical protein QYM36_009481 [Artemia franciscana]|uniref:ASD2 domain-containing protein n=1 Tax=Artemia franciscana TaxID=6661 RepID=A0AA88HKL7_ARTSF|nr:hypothetical protein QYM36_009481 [Artemia franciscana]
MTNEDKINKEPAFVSESLKTKYILQERADPFLKDEKLRKGSHIPAEDGRLYIFQSLPMPSNGANIHGLDFKKKTYGTKPPLEKEAQTKKLGWFQKKIIGWFQRKTDVKDNGTSKKSRNSPVGNKDTLNADKTKDKAFWRNFKNPGKNNPTHRHSNKLGKVRNILGDEKPPALPAKISPAFCESSASSLKPPTFQSPPPVLSARLSPSGLENRPMTPDSSPLPLPSVVSSDGALEDEPQPLPPPSPLLSKGNNKESYSETAGKVTSPVMSTDNFTSLDSPCALMSCEKLHNINSNETTVVFTSEDLAKIKEKHKMVQKLSTESTYKSKIIIYPPNEQVQLEILAKKQNTEDLSSHLIVPRQKGLEEIECDKLTVELAKQLPESDELKSLLGVTDVKTASDYVKEIFGPGTINVVSRNYSYHAKNGIAAMENGEEMFETGSPQRSVSPLAKNSVYLISSEPKTNLLTQCNDYTEKTYSDTDSLLQLKEDLVKRLNKKLEILCFESQATHENMSSNEKLGKEVSSRLAEVATSGEQNKVARHVLEVETITALLFGLAGRLARAQNVLASLGEDVNSQEKTVLESKRDKLIEQIEEAQVLKLGIEKRSRNVSTLLQKYFTRGEYADYEHFVTMKAKLAVDAREIKEKMKLGEEQLLALKETLSENLGPVL